MPFKAIYLTFILMTLCAITKGIQVSASHTVFYKKNKKDTSKIDANILLAWRVSNSSLHYTRTSENKLSSEYVLIVKITNNNTIVKEENYLIKNPPLADMNEMKTAVIADQLEYTLPIGEYELEYIFYEEDYKNELFRDSKLIRIDSVHQKRIFTSGIQLLDTFFLSNVESVYSRNGYIDYTSSTAFIDETKNELIFYHELYPQKNWISKSTVHLKYDISWKPFAVAVPSFEYNDTIIVKDELIGVHKSISIAKLKSGNYYLNCYVYDGKGNELDKKNVFFQRYLPNNPKSNEPNTKTTVQSDTSNSSHILDLTSTFVGKYTAAQVRSILKMLLLICDETEGVSINDFLKKPDELYSKYFIYNFWEKRNKTNPEAAWNAYVEKIKEVNRLFKAGGKSGYETDRGRVYIQYGKPNERVIVNNESGALPYEIWQYYFSEKQAKDGVFLFYKPGKAVGEYQLLHSTWMGEKRNTSWRSLLYNNSISGSGNLDLNSQAEQYIGNK